MMTAQITRLTSLSVAGICLTATMAFAQSNSKGRNSPVIVGQVVSVDDDIILVRQSGEAQQRKLTVVRNTTVTFVGFKGIGKTVDAPQKGFGVKAKVSQGDTLKSILYTPPLPESRDIRGKHKLTEAEIFKKTDLNDNERVDYVEFSITIHRSEKHGPDSFPKLDRNGDDALDLREFKLALSDVGWWRLSRKTPTEWMQTADQDGSGVLSKAEFGSVSQGRNHVDRVFARTDQDNSGGVSLSELEGYLTSIITPTSRKKK